jgi:demethylmenaquinone methyltransferase/2-methoxy-6-polyprenyl-1,4-benzoquinol methylase
MPAKKPSAQKTSNHSRSSLTSNAVPLSPGLTVRAMFDNIAAQYDRFNALASLGLHQHWRRSLVRRIPSGVRVLDLATGTGDVAFLAAKDGHEVVGADFSENMLAKAREKDPASKIRWISASAERLPFSDRSFGCVTSAFALRNLRSCLDEAFSENFRVLTNQGTVLHLDFGRPKSGFFRLGHRAHMAFGVPLIGQWLCGAQWPKGYLETTINQFYEPVEVEEKLKKAGFIQVTHTSLLSGVVQLFEGKKIE